MTLRKDKTQVLYLDHDRWIAASRAGTHGMVEIRLRIPLYPQFRAENSVLSALINARATLQGKVLRSLGADLFSTSDADALYLGLSTPVEHTVTAMQTAIRMLTASEDNSAEVNMAVRYHAQMIDIARQDPATVADEWTNELIYGLDHPYGARLDSTALSQLSAEMVYHAMHVTLSSPETRIALAGDAPPESLVKMAIAGVEEIVVQHMARVPVLPVPNFGAASWNRHRSDQNGAQLRVVWPAPGRSSEKLPGAELMVAALGGGNSSRLFKEVREKHGLCYGIRARIVHADAMSACVLNISTRSRHADEAMRVILETTERFSREELPTATELSQWSARLRTSRAVASSTPTGMVERLIALWQSWADLLAVPRKQEVEQVAASPRDMRFRAEDWPESRISSVAQQTFPAENRLEVVLTGD